MSLEVTKNDIPGRKFTVKDRLYIDADGKIVDEDDPTAAFLYSTPGKRIPWDEAVEKGLVKDDAPTRGNAGSKPTKAQIRKSLDERGIDYDANANRNELAAVLEQAEGATPAGDAPVPDEIIKEQDGSNRVGTPEVPADAPPADPAGDATGDVEPADGTTNPEPDETPTERPGDADAKPAAKSSTKPAAKAAASRKPAAKKATTAQNKKRKTARNKGAKATDVK